MREAASCQVFNCLWLRGAISGDDSRRPDKLGLLFDCFHRSGTQELRLVAFELLEPALLTSRLALAMLAAWRGIREVQLSTGRLVKTIRKAVKWLPGFVAPAAGASGHGIGAWRRGMIAHDAAREEGRRGSQRIRPLGEHLRSTTKGWRGRPL